MLDLVREGALDQMTYRIAMVFFDVASACNLACPFCVFDWSTLKKGSIATPEVLAKVFQLLQYVPEAGLSLSCAHEPTMHPRLATILRELPEDYRKKFFMTTNMTNRMSAELIDAIAGCGIAHVNISCDTLDPEKFLYLRKGGKLDDFLANMEHLQGAIERGDPANRPKLRFITMGFKSNFNEIPAIVSYGKRFDVVAHEIRYLFDADHIEQDFKRREILNDDGWQWLQHFAKDKPWVEVVCPPAGHVYGFQRAGDAQPSDVGSQRPMAYSGDKHLDNFLPPIFKTTIPEIEIGPKKSARYVPTLPLPLPRTANGTVPPYEKIVNPPTLHISPEGSVTLTEWTKEQFEINILSIGDPGAFFSALIQPSGVVSPGFIASTLDGFRPLLIGDIWSESNFEIGRDLRDRIWRSDLELKVFAPRPIGVFRVACVAREGSEFTAVKEKYLHIGAGTTIYYFRIDELPELRPGLSSENLTHILVGGRDQEPMEICITLSTDTVRL